jgi:hypothetical protein
MEFRVSGVTAYEPSAYLVSQYRHRKQVTALRAEEWSISESVQKQRILDVRQRLALDRKPYKIRALSVDNVENPKAWITHEPAPYDEFIPEILDRQDVHPVNKNWKQIVGEVCHKHGVSFEEITSPRRPQRISRARREAFYRLTTETNFSLPRIGRFMGGFDHSSVSYSVRKYKEENGL